MQKVSRATAGTNRTAAARGDGSGRARRMTLDRLSLSACLTALALAASCSSASAETAHTFAGSFGGASTSPADPYPLGGPTAVAVDNSKGPSAGDVYVTDPAHYRVEKFDTAGNLILMFGREVDETTKGNVCTVASKDVCKTGVQGAGPSEFSAPAFVAVDPSTGPSAGDVYVADTASNTVQKYTPEGALVTTWGDHTPTPNGVLEGKNVPAGKFGALDGIAVDANGHLWVLEAPTLEPGSPKMHEYGQEGAAVGEEFRTSTIVPAGIAVDPSEDLYVLEGPSSYDEAAEELTSTGQQVRDIKPVTPASGVAVDPAHGDLYLDTSLGVEHFEPSAFGSGFTELFGSPELVGGRGLAAQGSNGVVFAADVTENVVDRFAVGIEAETEPATGVTASTATVNGTVNPHGDLVTECAVEYGVEEGNYTHSQPCAEAPGAGSTPAPVHADLTGLQPGTTYYARVLAGDEHGLLARGIQVSFTTSAQAVAEGFSVGELTATGAVLHATVDPNGLTVASCVFEYGTGTGYGHNQPCTPGELGEGGAPVPVTATLTELKANTEYHWRISTTDTNGTYQTPDETFRYAEETPGLPDGRRYELVTPDHKNAALVNAVFLNGIPAEVGDDGTVLMTSLQCFAGSPGCTAARGGEGEPYLFTRSSRGWATDPLAPPAATLAANTAMDANAESGLSLFAAPGGPSGSEMFYADAGTTLEAVGPIGPNATGKGKLVDGMLLTRSASGTLHLVYESGDGRLQWPFDETIFNGHNVGFVLYEYEGTGGSAPRLVGVLGGAGSHELVSRCGTELGGESQVSGQRYGSLSDDGETVYFTVDKCLAEENYGREVSAHGLYVRYEHSRTEQISTPVAETCKSQVCRTAPAGDALFQGASSDGSRAFFTSSQRLTDDASEDTNPADSPFTGKCPNTAEGLSGCNLYESECPERCKSPSARQLIDVSAGEPGYRGARVQGVVQISPDGSHVYFVSKGVLTGKPGPEGALPVEGQPNLYAYQRTPGAARGQLEFIATLSPEDNEEWINGIGEPANVTPDGRHLLFTSHRALTSDDTRPEGPAQIYLYDDQTASLTRITKGQDGYDDNGNTGTGNATIRKASKGESNAVGPRRPDPSMSDDGSYVYFESPIALTSHALNDFKASPRAGLSENIYEYHNGQISLITAPDTAEKVPLEDGKAVELIGTDGSGANVLFLTDDQLVPQDTNTERDLYDAHICSETEPCAPTTEPETACSEEACQLTAETPARTAPPASGAFTGPGNLITALPDPPAKTAAKPVTRAEKLAVALRLCRSGKRPRHARVSCETRARRLYGTAARRAARRTRRTAR